MADDGNTQTPQQTLPGVQTQAQSSGPSAAEKRLAEIEAREKAEKDAAAKAERDKELADAENARKAAADAEAREKAALERIAAYEDKERKRIAAKLENVDEDARKRLEKIGAKLSVDDYAELVDAAVAKSGTSGSGKPADISPAGPKTGRREPGLNGKRSLPDKAQDILDQLGVNSDAARNNTVVELSPEGNSARVVFPAARLIQKMKERAIQPRRLDAENLRRLRGGV
jgi:membrane protein involved in colicin uptake